MDDTTLRIAVGLRLGTTICAPHICQCCGAEVSAQGIHGLSCKASIGHHFCHAAINNIIHHTMSAAGIPARLEPTGFSRSDGKRPGGMSLLPWESGRPLVWDATCPDTFAVSYRGQATSGVMWLLCQKRGRLRNILTSPFHSCGHRVFRCHWPSVQGISAGAGEACAAGIR